ncbi:zinc-ribbon domain-containing protein [Candidatus Pelagibacter sp.]|nr:zinc-ribbon domain-containing protein [Candidatus Pelagibacter sp.]MDB4246289.1 zinc-ribbon domain-containing protein [Candidatus Pelagibacter sp.]
MIITCNNCNKKFDIDANLIPNKGRLLQCASCDHKWFFKKEVLENDVSPIVEDIDNDSVNIFDQNNPSNNDEINPSDLTREEIEVDIEEKLDEKIKVNNEEEPKNKIDANINESTAANTKPKKQKNFKILNIFIVAIISFVAFIIIVDTFKYPIGKIVPNIEFILYNLYESFKDISLFIRDLT